MYMCKSINVYVLSILEISQNLNLIPGLQKY